MNFKTDIMNIPLNQYLIIRKKYTPIITSFKAEEGYLLAKVINIRRMTLSNLFTDDLVVVCSIFGVEEEKMHDIFLMNIAYGELIPVIKNVKSSNIISYYVITPEDYPFLINYYWLDDVFKEEAFGALI